MKNAFLLATCVLSFSCGALLAAEKASFWDKQRKGANGDGGKDSADWFRAAAEFGLEGARITYRPAKAVCQKGP